MAAESVRLQRSFSYGPDTAGSSEGEETLRRSSISQKRSRTHSIVGSLWSFLYSRRQSPLDVSLRRRHEEEEDEEETDHGGSPGQEQAWMQAYYNGVAVVVLLVSGYLCWAVYCVLEPFLHPLLWAILAGIILHPFKKTWTQRISQWLDLLEANSIPLSAGLVLSPLFLFNHLSKLLESAIVTYWWAILASTVGTALLWLLYRLSVPIHLYHFLTSLHSFLLHFEAALTTYAGYFQLSILLLVSVLVLLVCRSTVQERGITLTSLSVLVWFLLILNVAVYIVGSTVAIPLVVGVFMIGGVVSFVNSLGGVLGGVKTNSGRGRKKSAKVQSVRGEDVSGELGEKKERPSFLEGSLEDVRCSGEPGESEFRGLTTNSTEISSETETLTMEGSEESENTKSHVSFGSVVSINPERQPWSTEGVVKAEPGWSQCSPSPLRHDSASSEEEEEPSQSYYVFLGLYSMFFVMVFWTHPFFLLLLIPFALWGALKRVVSLGIHRQTVAKRFSTFLASLRNRVQVQSAVLFPAPLPTLSRLYLSLDRVVLKFAKGSVDSLMSCFIIVGLLVSGLGLAVFLLLQIQVELSHYVAMMSAVWERTLESSPQLAE